MAKVTGPAAADRASLGISAAERVSIGAVRSDCADDRGSYERGSP
jgi:hypothetical protein